uniref:C3H1-type domain-containing protein n=1 Tax=Parascaris univalens TaxID=6257 RepID=A0A915BUD2_PARUN
FLIGSLATYGQFILHPLHFLQMVEEALPTSRRRARSAVAGKVERKLSWNSVDGTAADDLRTAMESRNIAVGSPVCALLNLIDSSFSAAESALQNMKEASRDRQNVANQPLTADENSFKEQIKKTDGFKRVVPRTRSPTKPHKRSIEDVSTDTNEGTLFKAHTAVHRERSAPARLTDSSSKLITVDKETNADCVATIFPTTRSRKEEGSFSCPQRRLCSSKHISERRRIHKPKRRIQGALVAPKRRAPKDTWRIRKQHLGNIRDSERYCQDCAWKAQKIRRRHERIKTGVGDDKYVHLISRNIGKKQDTRHHILMAGQGINGAHWLTPNNDQSIAGTKFCQCSPPQTKSISEQSSETSIGSMPRRSLKCLTCDSHKRRHHHSLMKPSSRKSHNSSDPLSRRSVARVTEQCLLSDALPISQHSRKKEGCDNIGYEAHSPGISYSSPHILKNEDVRSLQRHSCRERHQLPIPTYCIECGCSYLLAKPCPIRERRSRSESSKYEDVYNHGHEVVDGRPKHDEEGAHEERSNSACDSILKHQKYKLCSRCTRGVGDSGRGCHSRPMKERFSKIPQISWIKDWSRPKLRNTRKETLYSRIALNEACSTFVRRRPSQDEVAAPAVNSPRKIATRSASATSLIPLAAIMRTISSVQSLLKGSSTMPKREKQCSKLARSQSGRRFPAAQARQTRMIKSGPYGLISRRILERCNDNQPSTSIKNISYLETLKDAYSRSAGIASGKFLPIKRSSSTVTNTTALITVPSEITSDTPLASKTIEDSALTTVKSIRSPEMQTSSEVLHAASTATSTEDIIKTVLSSRQLPALPQKRLPTLAQPIVTSKSRSSLPSYGTPPKVDRMTSKLVKREGSCLNTAVTDASSGPHAIRSKNQNSQERTMPLVRRKTTVSRKNHNGCAKGKNMPICMSAASITPKKEAFRKTNTQTLNNAEKPNAANREVSTDRSEAYVVDSTPSHLPLNEKEAFETAVTMTPHRFAETAHEKSLMTTKEVSSVAEQSTSSITASEKSPRAAVFDELHSAVEKKLSSEKPNAANREVSTARSEACVVDSTPSHLPLNEKEAFETAVAMTPHRFVETAYEKSVMTTREVWTVAQRTASLITATERPPLAAVFDDLHSAVEKRLPSGQGSSARRELRTAGSEACVVARTPSHLVLNEKEAFETAVAMTPHRFVETAHEKSLITAREVCTVTQRTASLITATERAPRAAVFDELRSAVEKRLPSEKPNAANREVSRARSETCVVASTPSHLVLNEKEAFGIPLATAALEICVVSHPASCTSESTTSTTTDVSKSTQPPPRKESSDDARHLSMHTGKTNSCQTAQQVSMRTALEDDNESERKQASCSGSCVDSHRTLSTDRPLSSATLAEVERVSAQAHIAERNESLILPMQPSTHTGKTDSCQTAQQVSMRTALEDDNESERKQALCSGPCIVLHQTSSSSPSTSSTTTEVSKSTQPPPRKESSDDARHLSMHTGKTNSCQTAQQVSMRTALEDDNESERKQALCSGPCIVSHQTSCSSPPTSSTTTSDSGKVCKSTKRSPRKESTDAAEHLWMPIGSRTGTQLTEATYTSVLTAAAKERLQIIGDKQSVRIEAAMVYSKACPAGGSSYLGKTHKETAIIAKEPLTYIQKTNLRRTAHEISSPAAIMSDLRSASEPTLCSGLLSDMKGTWSTPPRFSIIAKETSQLDTHVELMHSEEVMVNTATLNTPLRGDILSAQRDSVCTAREPSMHLLKKPDCESTCETARKLRRLIFATRSKRAPMTTSDVQNFTPLTTKQNMEIADRGSIYQEHLRSALLHSSTRTPADKRTTNELSSITAKSDSQRSE